MMMSVSMGGAWPIMGMASTAAAKPPSTSAPSPPIMMRPMRAGIATASAVRMSGAERCSVFCSENAGAKAASPHIGDEVDRRLSDRQQKDREQRRCDQKRNERNDDVFRIGAQPHAKIGTGLPRPGFDQVTRGASRQRRVRHEAARPAAIVKSSSRRPPRADSPSCRGTGRDCRRSCRSRPCRSCCP